MIRRFCLQKGGSQEHFFNHYNEPSTVMSVFLSVREHISETTSDIRQTFVGTKEGWEGKAFKSRLVLTACIGVPRQPWKRGHQTGVCLAPNLASIRLISDVSGHQTWNWVTFCDPATRRPS